MGRSCAIAQRRNGSRTGSIQKEVCERNGQIHSAVSQTFSPKERNDAIFRHLDDDVLRKSRRFKTFIEAKEDYQGSEERVPQVGGPKEELLLTTSFGNELIARAAEATF
jgi:hypothetical protein